MDFKELQSICYMIVHDRGFHDHDPAPEFCFEVQDLIPRWLMLIVSEAAEAMEAYRQNDFDNFKEELADIQIRLMDTCEAMGINLEAEVLKKCKLNRSREKMHGGKRC